MRSGEVAILGLLLVDGLNEPANASSAGEGKRRGEEEGGLPDPINGRSGRGVENHLGSRD